MREEEIVKALELHKNRIYGKECCEGCPYNKYDGDCYDMLIQDVENMMKIAIKKRENESTPKSNGESYDDGLRDAWSVARRLFETGDHAMTTHELKACFGYVSERDILKYLDAETAVRKLKSYEKGFKYGEVVKNRQTGVKAVVVGPGKKVFSGLTKNGLFIAASAEDWEATDEKIDLSVVMDKL